MKSFPEKKGIFNLKNIFIFSKDVDPHSFDADPDPDQALNIIADPD